MAALLRTRLFGGPGMALKEEPVTDLVSSKARALGKGMATKYGIL